MSAKRPRARRSRMWLSVCSYAETGAAPTTSMPSSSASLLSSAARIWEIVPRVKAIRIHEDGGPEVLRYEDAPDPEPGPNFPYKSEQHTSELQSLTNLVCRRLLTKK